VPTIFERVKGIVVEQLGVEAEEVVPTASFVEDLNADSLDIVQILVAIEDTFDIEIVDEELQDVTDMGGFVAYIERKVAEK